MCPAYSTLPDSTYLDLGSYRGNGLALTGGTAVSKFTLNVALVMDRASDPLPLLNANWAQRQEQLAALNKDGTLWAKYGADPNNYRQVLSALDELKINTVGKVSPQNGYVSSAESRTVWVQLNESNFTTLFGPNATLFSTTTPTGATTWFWNGALQLADPLKALGVKGLWFDTVQSTFAPVLTNAAGATPAVLPQGYQSPGNASGKAAVLYPQQIAADYNFPLSKFPDTPTKAIGLVEPSVGSALPAGSQPFAELLGTYRTGATVAAGPVSIITVANGGQTFPASTTTFTNADERSIDVGIATTVNPRSPLIFYAGSGSTADAKSHAFTAYQSAIWDRQNNPEVVSSSFSFGVTTSQGQFIGAQPSPHSPFSFAEQQLFIDAALRNMSLFSSSGDRGSGDGFGNGLTNIARDSSYNVIVGGTSPSTKSAAANDPTLASIYNAAIANDPATLFQLAAGGLKTLPSTTSMSSNGIFIETVWNNYQLSGTIIADAKGNGYFVQNTGAGGTDPAIPVPRYQSDFGLRPTTADPDRLPGRGVPDVSADGGGNMLYTVPSGDLTGTKSEYGTSASTPLWASLAVQLNAIFQDQGLPPLGYMNDLLYNAAAIAPASFNEIAIGNNTSSFTYGGSYTSDGTAVTPTGFGYQAGPGYDLATGLGSPNGLLLARAMTAIAQAQTWSKSPAVFGASNAFSGVSTVAQTLIVQDQLGPGTATLLGVGTGAPVDAVGGSALAWTSRLAEQVLQRDFDHALVLQFDGASQGTTYSVSFTAGQGLMATAGGKGPLPLYQANYTNAFGIVEFGDASGMVVLARPVSVAQTAGGADNQDAIVRLRQVTTDTLKLELYKVDDFNGTIGGIAPGQAGYEAAAAARDYLTDNGSTVIAGPGHGNYGEARIKGVNAGDIVAMHLTNATTGDSYWAFAGANEKVDGKDITHLRNYGLNTSGWEAGKNGGDGDYNDLIVGIDFTSGAGHALIA
jgi:hypothetical protein